MCLASSLVGAEKATGLVDVPYALREFTLCINCVLIFLHPSGSFILSLVSSSGIALTIFRSFSKIYSPAYI